MKNGRPRIVVECFYQKIKPQQEVSVMSKKKVYLGLDVHARHCTLGCMDGRGNFHGTVTFRTNEKELIHHVDDLQAGKKYLALEEGPLAYWISQTLKSYVTEIVIADPREIPLVSRNARKNDRDDARNLCRLLRMGELRHVYHPEEDHRTVFKTAVQHYLDCRDHQTNLKRKIKAKYRMWGVVDIDGNSIYNCNKKDHFIRQIKPIAVRNQLERMYSLLEIALHTQSEALKEARRLGARYPEIKEFMKMPGVGPIGALIFDAYIQTPYRFRTKSEVYKYCKLSVTDKTSDNKPIGYSRLDPAGNSELKAMSYRTVIAARNMKRTNEVKRYYQDSLKQTKDKTHARLNTQRKIVSVMHGIWRKKEAYKPELF